MAPPLPPVFAELSPPYSTIVADPPWHYDDRLAGWRGADGIHSAMPYSTMAVDEIAALPVGSLAGPNAHLYLWTTNRYLWDCPQIIQQWGFAVSQVLVWCKPQRWRPGGVFGNATEFIVFARSRRRTVDGHLGDDIQTAREDAGLSKGDLFRLLGNGKSKALIDRWEEGACIPSVADWHGLTTALPLLTGIERPGIDAKRSPSTITNWWTWPDGSHSDKPEAFLDVVEQVSPGPYVELFCRRPRLGWDSWGKGYEIGAAS